MRSFYACLLVGLLLATVCHSPDVCAAVSSTNITATSQPPPGPPADGIRPEDVIIDDDAIGDVWETISPADAIGITDADADILPHLTNGMSSSELLKEKALLKSPRRGPQGPKRLRTQRWRPKVPVQTLFYLLLALIVVAVLLLKARG